MIHAFLLIGQSNMAGQGIIDEVPPIENENIKMLVNGYWRKMLVPLHREIPASGIGLAESFADAYAKEHNVTVGLIPCAVGGTSLKEWREGGILYENAVNQARLADRTATIAGVLWHQGERDSRPNLAPLYYEKCMKIFNALRRDLNLYDVPFVVGGLGEYLKTHEKEEIRESFMIVNEELQRMAQDDPMIGYASSVGLTPKADNVHLNSASLREFGLRYYEAFKKMEDPNKIFTEKPNERGKMPKSPL